MRKRSHEFYRPSLPSVSDRQQEIFMKALHNYLALFALLLGFLSLYIPIRGQTSYPMEIGPQLDKRVRTKYTDMLNEQRPEVLLLGDSMLAPAVDEEIVTNRLGKKTILAGQPGTASAVWYLMVKNNIIIAEHKPKYLVLFFRDAMLTVPGYRVTGSYFEMVDEYASPDDKLLIERAYSNQMSWPEKIMERYVPLYARRSEIRRGIDHSIRYAFSRVGLHCDTECIDAALEKVFAEDDLDELFFNDALAAADEYMYTSERLNFNDQVGKSFLPEMIRLCEQNDIQLILVRMPILRSEEPGVQPSGLSIYVQDLARYLDKNEVPFFDFDQQGFPSEYFSDRVHLNERGEAAFTQKLVASLTEVIK